MKNPILPLFAVLLGCALWADLALPHGGSFRGPNGGVPPGLREPSDPEPPPPPPSDPGNPGNPTTPPGGVPGVVTPHDTPSDTPGGGIPPPTLGRKQGKRRGQRTPSLTFESWRFWWAYNKDDILNLKSHVVTGGTTSGGFFPFGQSGPGGNRRSLMRPTQRAIEREILPALLETANHPGNHQDIHGAALIALAKAGASDRIRHFRDVLHNRYVNPQGRRIDFGYQATESAVLALGLLPDLDEANRDVVRGICLEAVADESLRTRERAWAAVSLGLQRDRKAVRPLMTLLTKEYPDDNVPAGILAGIGLIGDGSVLPELVEIIVRERFAGIRMSPRLQAFAGYAISKIGDPAALDGVLKVLRSRRRPRESRRSAAIAAGVLGARAPLEKREEVVKALIRFVDSGARDPSGENFALIALSQVGTPKAFQYLLKVVENGKYGQRPFAALGMATHVFHRGRAAAAGDAEPMDPVLRKRIVEKLRRLSAKVRDTDTRAALMLCRGLVMDRDASEELIAIIMRRSAPSVLRGYCSVALGLLGDGRQHAREALRLALKERRSSELRRDAATGLALLRDGAVVGLLIDELKKARTFSVQGQLITAIGTLGHHGATRPLIELLRDRKQPAATRAMAAVGLGMIADLQPLPTLSRLSKNYNYRASVKDLDELLFIL